MSENKLRGVHIKGFRSIGDAYVPLGDINILIGPNGSGKSNFVSALYFLQNISDKKLRETVGRAGLPSLLYGGPKAAGSIEMEFVFDRNSYGFVLSPNGTGDLVFADEYYGFDEGKSSVPARPFRYESEFEKGVSDRTGEYVRPVLEAKKWYVYQFRDTSAASGMKQAAKLSDTAYLKHDASNLAPFLYMIRKSYPDSYADILRVIKMAAPFFGDFVLEPDSENGELIRLGWRRSGSEEVLDADRMSDGTLRFVCLAVLMLQPSELQPTMIMLDGPEPGLHPYAVSVFAELVHMVSPKRQLIISTQSADLLNHFDADDVIVAELTSEGSRYKRLSSEDHKDWLEEYSLGTVWKKNVFGGRP